MNHCFSECIKCRRARALEARQDLEKKLAWRKVSDFEESQRLAREEIAI